MLSKSTKTQQRHLFNLDPVLMSALFVLCAMGLSVLYSAASHEMNIVLRQAVHIAVGFVVLIFLAQISSDQLFRWSPWLYLAGLALLVAVLTLGYTGKGAQRWLDLGILRFQPSEVMKIVLPMAVAWYLSNKPAPISISQVVVAVLMIAFPTWLISIQPDLGTALLVSSIGFFVIFLAGIPWRFLALLGGMVLAGLPMVWFYLHDYQQQRILTLLDPERDPLGTGYHIIQSKIAIGSGGVFGKGWLNGTQSQLDFIPERTTDFIFAVLGEEFGFFGVVLLLLIYGFVVMRGLHIASGAGDTYSRVLAGSLSLSFFVYFVVNIGMVSGLLPVVGVPLPLISYGGTSAVTILATFGILMSIQSRRKLFTS